MAHTQKMSNAVDEHDVLSKHWFSCLRFLKV